MADSQIRAPLKKRAHQDDIGTAATPGSSDAEGFSSDEREERGFAPPPTSYAAALATQRSAAPAPGAVARPGPSAESLPKRPKAAAMEKLEKSRERNRIHARKTRERKKARLLELQEEVQRLEREQAQLQGALDERAVAQLLLQLSGGGFGPQAAGMGMVKGMKHPGVQLWGADIASEGSASADGMTDEEELEELEPCLPAHLTASVGGKSASEREHIRRERNRLHAKRTRQRKKLVFQELERRIKGLERRNAQLRAALAEVCQGVPPVLKSAVPAPLPVFSSKPMRDLSTAMAALHRQHPA